MMLLLIKVLTLKALCPEWASQCFIVTLTILNTPKRYESIGLIAKLSDDDVEKTAEFGNYEPNAFYNANLSRSPRINPFSNNRRYEALRIVLGFVRNILKTVTKTMIYIYLRTGPFLLPRIPRTNIQKISNMRGIWLLRLTKNFGLRV